MKQPEGPIIFTDDDTLTDAEKEELFNGAEE